MQDPQAAIAVEALSKKDLTINTVTFLTPKYVLLSVIKSGFAKAQLPLSNKLILGFLAGGYIALGGLIAMIVAGGMAGADGFGVSNPGLQRLLSAASFPFCLMLVVLAGSELFTSNCMALPAAAFAGKITPGQVAKSLLISYLCNFAGSLFVAYFLVYLPNVLGAEPYVSYVKKLTVSKINSGWGTLFLKGIGANWLVCLAIWNSLAAGDITGKILGIWWPIFAFVLAGFEHSIANMFYLPIGLMHGADSTVGHFLWNHLVPVTLGNFVGGCVMVAMPTYYIWGEHAAPQVAVMTVRPVPGIPKSASNMALPPRIASLPRLGSLPRDLVLQQYVASASKNKRVAPEAPLGAVAASSSPLDGTELSQVVIHGDLGTLGTTNGQQ